MMDQINKSKYFPAQNYSPRPEDPTIMVSYNRRYRPLDGGKSKHIGDMCNLKHDISSPKLYDILIKK